MENQSVHEGELLRNYFKGTGKQMTYYFEALGMTRQNLNHHLRKSSLDDDFKRLIKDKLNIVIVGDAVMSGTIQPAPPKNYTSIAGTNAPKSVLGKIQAFLRAFDAPLAKWVAEKVDGPGLDEKDIDYLEDRIEQIKASIPGEISKMEEEFKLLKLKNKK